MLDIYIERNRTNCGKRPYIIAAFITRSHYHKNTKLIDIYVPRLQLVVLVVELRFTTINTSKLFNYLPIVYT